MRKLGLALCISILAAGCGGGNDSAAPTEAVVGPTQTVTSTETVTVSVTLGPTTSASISLSGSTFQLPSKNIGCTSGEGVLVCDILSGLSPEPKRSCEVDWTGMEMERLGPAQPRCAGDTAYDQKSPVLAYGESWARDGFSCTSAQTGLRCLNQDGRGFTLSRERWSQF